MKEEHKEKIRLFLEAIELIEKNYGYIFKGSDEHRDLVATRKAVKALVRVKRSKALDGG